jgi:hypothetical protein
VIKGIAAACALAVGALGVMACSSASSGTSNASSAGGDASLGGVTATCKPMWATTGANYSSFAAAQAADATTDGGGGELYQFAFARVTASSTVDIGSVAVVLYNKSGTEVGSAQYPASQTILTAGQSETVEGYLDDIGTNGPPDWASCRVVGWTPPSGY